jgi:hypothetical protein
VFVAEFDIWIGKHVFRIWNYHEICRRNPLLLLLYIAFNGRKSSKIVEMTKNPLFPNSFHSSDR